MPASDQDAPLRHHRQKSPPQRPADRPEPQSASVWTEAKAIIRVPGLKVAVPLAADALPRDLVAADGPAGEPTIDLVLEGGSLTARAKLNGKNYRKMLKQIAEQGAANVAVVLQGVLRPAATPGEPFVLEGAGFQVNVKTPKPAEGALDKPPPETSR